MRFYSWITGTSAEEVVNKPDVITLEQLKPCHQQQDYLEILELAPPVMKKKSRAKERPGPSIKFAFAQSNKDEDYPEIQELASPGIIKKSRVKEFPGPSIESAFAPSNKDEIEEDYPEILELASPGIIKKSCAKDARPDPSIIIPALNFAFAPSNKDEIEEGSRRCDRSVEDAYSSMAPDPAFAFVEERLKPDDINALVFQGGGAKGIAYCGVIKELSKRKILQKVRRFGGASAGAICAAFLALGCSADRIRELLNQDFYEMLMGDSWYDKVLSFIPGQKYLRAFISTIHNYGLYSTASFHDWMGYEFTKLVNEKEQLSPRSKKIINKANITFKEVYDLFGVELCVIVSNVSTETEEYYHPKTTPEFPVRDAVIISMSIPLLFKPVTIPFYNEEEYFVDGGVICNFPVHCFDGWWLSMDPQDAFPQKFEGNFQTICSDLRTSRFKNTDRKSKTLGFRVVMEKKKTRQTEAEVMKQKKTTPTEAENVGPWKTALSTKYNERIKAQNRGLEKVRDIDELLNALRTGVVQADHTMVSRDTILNCLSKAPELKQKLEMEQREGDICFTFRDLESAIYEITKRPLAEWMTNNPKKKIHGLFDFVHCLTNLLDVTSKADDVYRDYHACNEWRTITIETKYIDTTDFKMEYLDKEFLIQQGETATRDYFNVNPPRD